MSEAYRPSPHSKNEAPLEETLFDDDAFIGEVEAQAGSKEEAFRQLGIKAPEIIEPSLPRDGAFVELGARALAIHELMDGINYRNKTEGAHITSETGGSDFNARQKSPEDTLSGMRFNLSQREKANKDYIDTLNATDGMMKAGFSPEVVQWSRNRIVQSLAGYEGTGRRNVASRKKLDEKIQAVASRQNKPRS